MKGKVSFRKRSEFAALRPDSGQGKVCPLFYWFPGNCKGQQITPWLNWHWATFFKNCFCLSVFFWRIRHLVKPYSIRREMQKKAINCVQLPLIAMPLTLLPPGTGFASLRISLNGNFTPWTIWNTGPLNLDWQGEVEALVNHIEADWEKGWIIFFTDLYG